MTDEKSVLIISIGTYEGILYVSKIYKSMSNNQVADADQEIYRREEFFRATPHIGSIRVINSSKKYLVSAGSDGTIALYNHQNSKAVGTLDYHSDSVDCLDFFEDKYLVSGSMDNNICLWRTSDWALTKEFTGHTSAVTSLSISPSGKFMLSVGKDSVLRMWDLMRAHNANTRKLPLIANFIGFSSDSRKFILGFNKLVTVNDGSSEDVIYEFSTDTQITSYYLNKDDLWLGLNDGRVIAWNIETNVCYGSYQIEKSRIKYVDVKDRYIVTMTSDGNVKLGIIDDSYEIDTVLQWKVQMRITCGNMIVL